MDYWDLEPGEELPRGERVKRFGGNGQSGIAQSRKTPNVFLYSDEEASKNLVISMTAGLRMVRFFSTPGGNTETNLGQPRIYRYEIIKLTVGLYDFSSQRES